MVLTFILYSSSSSAMDWLHCNLCFQRDGRNLAVSSCGHISCEGCVNPEQCNICGAICSYLPISDKMKPQEKVYFKDPVKLLQSRLEHIAQIAAFQHRQKDRTLAYFKQKVLDLERRVKEIMEQSYRELSELRRENSELKKPLSQRRVSPGQFQSSSSYRLSRPVAVTPPVTPRLRICNVSHPGSGEPMERLRDGRSHGPVTPGSAFSLSSLSSLQDPRTPTGHLGTPHRQESATPSFFQFGSVLRLHSPTPWTQFAE
ncbi:RING finger protein 212B-like isoform X2 [Anguilla anguilla]|uniref:RING finger protein 212B-like isoform X2 n=1 Tax=Anguilla anguilla TaxID=7936 RepID=UPI0015B0FE7B|nr:RING finger protein 212B-like isoform X2 [Anguilla anguilla]